MKNLLFKLGGGIGNIIQATPAINAAHSEGWNVDLMLHCNSTNDVLQIFNIPAVRKIYLPGRPPKGTYDVQLNGPFVPGKKFTKKTLRSRVFYAQHTPEAEVYYDLVKQIGVKTPMKKIEINIGKKGRKPKFSNSVAIYPGSKSNWAMKRWDKYDQLATKLPHVMVVGTKQDIHSHGNPTWITKPWQWPKDKTEFFLGTLREVAYAISHCKYFIGNDGGLAHIAAATGIPTFVLFGPSSHVKNKPYADNAHVIGIDLPCRPCQFRKTATPIFDGNKANCNNNMRCMRNMTAAYVLKRVKAILR
jgi:hypothetical protein